MTHPLDWLNPMLLKELRSRMRGRKGFMSLVLFVFLQVVVFLAIYGSKAGSFALSTGYVENRYAEIGRYVYQGFTVLILFLVLLFTPAFSATTLTVEKERKTLDFLRMTALGPFRIVLGKLLASLCTLLLLLTTSLPIMSLVFFFGGVSPLEIARAYGYAVLLALLLGAVGIWISATSKKSTNATSAAYGLAFLFLGTVFPGLIFVLFGDRGHHPVLHVPFFSGEISLLLAVAIAVGVLSLALLQIAAAQLRDPDSDKSTGERGSLALLVVVAAFLVQGILHGTMPRTGTPALRYTELIVVTAVMGGVALFPLIPLLCVRRPSRWDVESSRLRRWLGLFTADLLRGRIVSAPFVTAGYFLLWMGVLLVTAFAHGLQGAPLLPWLGKFALATGLVAMAHLIAGLGFAGVSAMIPKTATENGSYVRGLVLVFFGLMFFSSNLLHDTVVLDRVYRAETGVAGTLLIAMSPANALWSVFDPTDGYMNGYSKWLFRDRIPLWNMTLVLYGILVLLLIAFLDSALERARKRRERPEGKGPREPSRV